MTPDSGIPTPAPPQRLPRVCNPCTRCGQPGHHRNNKNCPLYVVEAGQSSSSSTSSSSSSSSASSSSLFVSVGTSAVEDDNSDDDTPDGEVTAETHFNVFGAPVTEGGNLLHVVFPADGEDNEVADDSNLPADGYEWTTFNIREPEQKTKTVRGKTIEAEVSMITNFAGNRTKVINIPEGTKSPLDIFRLMAGIDVDATTRTSRRSGISRHLLSMMVDIFGTSTCIKDRLSDDQRNGQLRLIQ